MTLRLATIVGARPQFVKAAVVSRALRRRGGLDEQIIHTGQHYDAMMSDIFFDELEIASPAVHLAIGSGSHGRQTGRMLEQLEAVLVESRPDAVLVYGDTNSTLAGGLAAAKLHIPTAHVEAGLRSFNREMPEEINRVLVDHLSSLLFAPTPVAVENLRQEGIATERIREVGDVMYDAAMILAERAERHSEVLSRNSLQPKHFILATIHRAENTDDPERLAAVFEGFVRIAGELPVVIPLHPRTRAALQREGRLEAIEQRLTVIEPVGYLDMVNLEMNSRIVITDSGGVQKEAFFFRVPCLTVRDETEWTETIEAGANRLIEADAAAMVLAVQETLGGETNLPDPGPLFGNGVAADRIAEALANESLRL